MSFNQTEKRQAAIKDLIQKIAISDQKQLVELLKSEHSIKTNQTVTSRDLRKLGIVKKLVNGALIYEIAEIDVTKEILKLAVLDIVHNESMILIKTYPGIADYVGDYIDKNPDLDILGCLSGENIIFVTPKSIKTIEKTFEKVCKLVHFKKTISKERNV